MDKLVWHYSPSGDYTFKTAYHLANKIIDGVWHYTETPWRAVWKVKTAPKVRAFYGRLCKGWSAVRTTLWKCYLMVDALCPLCAQMPETLWYLFVDCSFAGNCWAEGTLWQKIDALCYQVEGRAELFPNLSWHLEPSEMEREMMTTWAIWRARNDVVWNEKWDTPSRSLFSAMNYLAD